MRPIDADELLTAFPVDDEPTITKSCVRMTIKNMPTIEPEWQWIPCSERLPNAHEDVIVSCLDDSGDTEYVYTSCGWLTIDKKCWIVDNEENRFVKAWMPLPEPYREEGD